MKSTRKNVGNGWEGCVRAYWENSVGMYREINVGTAAPGCPVERSSTKVRSLRSDVQGLMLAAGSPKPEAGSPLP